MSESLGFLSIRKLCEVEGNLVAVYLTICLNVISFALGGYMNLLSTRLLQSEEQVVSIEIAPLVTETFLNLM